MTVHKYRLPFTDYADVLMPRGAEPLYVAAQHDDLCLWARVDPDAPPVTHRFRIAGTGHPEAIGRHIGSALMLGGSIVLHVFYLPEQE